LKRISNNSTNKKIWKKNKISMSEYLHLFPITHHQNNEIRIKAIKKERGGRINRFGIIRRGLCFTKKDERHPNCISREKKYIKKN